MSLNNEFLNYASWCYNLCKKSGFFGTIPNVSWRLVSKRWHYILKHNKRIHQLVSQSHVTVVLYYKLSIHPIHVKSTLC